MPLEAIAITLIGWVWFRGARFIFAEAEASTFGIVLYHLAWIAYCGALLGLALGWY